VHVVKTRFESAQLATSHDVVRLRVDLGGEIARFLVTQVRLNAFEEGHVLVKGVAISLLALEETVGSLDGHELIDESVDICGFRQQILEAISLVVAVVTFRHLLDKIIDFIGI